LVCSPQQQQQQQQQHQQQRETPQHYCSMDSHRTANAPQQAPLRQPFREHAVVVGATADNQRRPTAPTDVSKGAVTSTSTTSTTTTTTTTTTSVVVGGAATGSAPHNPASDCVKAQQQQQQQQPSWASVTRLTDPQARRDAYWRLCYGTAANDHSTTNTAAATTTVMATTTSAAVPVHPLPLRGWYV
jgi:hypothetical protein